MPWKHAHALLMDQSPEAVETVRGQAMVYKPVLLLAGINPLES
jgi:hypothetical protein